MKINKKLSCQACAGKSSSSSWSSSVLKEEHGSSIYVNKQEKCYIWLKNWEGELNWSS
jgi:hypothetical protein